MGIVRAAVAFTVSILALFSPRVGMAQALVSAIPNVAGTPVVNPVTHRAWFSHGGQDLVLVVDGASVVTRIAMPATPGPMAFNTALNRIYNAVYDSNYSLAVIDGNTNTVRLIYAAQMTGPLVVSERTNRVYGRSTRVSGQVVAYDASDNRSTLSLPYGICDMALNDRTNQLFVSHCATNEGASVVDLDSGAVTTVPFPGATAAGPVVVNTTTNRAYVASRNGTTELLVIDGSTKASRVLRLLDTSTSVPSLAVSSANNRVYVAWGTRIVTLDGNTDSVVAVTNAPGDVSNLRVDGATNRVYGLAGPVRLIALNANGAIVSTLGLPFSARTMDLDSATQRIYVAGDGAALIDASASAAPSGPDYQGMWWGSPAGRESGWGVDIAQQGNVWFATWFTYDENGEPTWFVMPHGDRTSGDAFSGTLYKTTGPDYSASPWDPSRVTVQEVGTLSFRFSDADNGTMEAVVNGTRITKPITRQVFALPVPTCETAADPGIENFTDLFWNPSQSGWGLFLTHQGNIVFTVWYTYLNGKPVWYVASNVTKDPSRSGGRLNLYSGTLYRTSGTPYSLPWNPSRMNTVSVGVVTLDFYDDLPTFSWELAGASGQNSLRREAFGNPRTYCHN